MTASGYMITGVAGFIGGHLAEYLLRSALGPVFGVDNMGYAADEHNVASNVSLGMEFVNLDLRDMDSLTEAMKRHRPTVVFHLAAESHVDRSIDSGIPFVEANVMGTANLLDWARTASANGTLEKLIHVSTDEVFGEAEPGVLFNEETRYDPHSPYSASKAAADHVARAWARTYDLPLLVTNCSNNYGPRQFPEKLLPHTVIRALLGKPIPVYGDGLNERDWISVDDHVSGLVAAADRGVAHETYLLGARDVYTNIDLVRRVCSILDDLVGAQGSHADLIEFVDDRPGHDRRYAIDPSKAEKELGWRAETSIDGGGLQSTIEWYLANRDWWQVKLESGDYDLERIGFS